MANVKPIPDNTGKEYRTLKINHKAQMFSTFYLSPTSDTFCNVYQSALRAGYSDEYAQNITSQRPKWWIQLTETADFRRAQMLDKAESRLNERLDDKTSDKDRLKLQTDVAKFVSERLGKDKYSTRNELTGADGRRLFTNETRDGAKMPLATLFKGVQATE
jgi:hypothetical protein